VALLCPPSLAPSIIDGTTITTTITTTIAINHSLPSPPALRPIPRPAARATSSSATASPTTDRHPGPPTLTAGPSPRTREPVASRSVCALPAGHSSSHRVLRRLFASGWVSQCLVRHQPLLRFAHLLRLIDRRQQAARFTNSVSGTRFERVRSCAPARLPTAGARIRQYESASALHGCQPVSSSALWPGPKH